MIKEGTNVQWDWADSKANGEVQEIFKKEVTKTINGEEITRKASQDNPAYLIKQSDGQRVLKSQSEVERCN